MCYRYDQYADAWDTSVSINIDGETVRFFHTLEKGVDRVWVDHESFLAKVHLGCPILPSSHCMQRIPRSSKCLVSYHHITLCYFWHSTWMCSTVQ